MRDTVPNDCVRAPWVTPNDDDHDVDDIHPVDNVLKRTELPVA